MQQNQESLYTRYCRMGHRFEISGGLTLAAAIAGHYISGRNVISTAMMVVGFLLLVFGLANMRPNNQIKSFAAQLTNTPDNEFAQGLLDAITKNGKTLLSGRSLSNVQQAIEVYAMSEGKDEALIAALRDAVEKHLRHAVF